VQLGISVLSGGDEQGGCHPDRQPGKGNADHESSKFDGLHGALPFPPTVPKEQYTNP
jgi:hypothetical protein